MFQAKIRPLVLALIVTATPLTAAKATPLFGEAEGYVTIGTVTLYRDSVDPNLLYFAPNTGRFAMNERTGHPRVSFVHWGVSGPVLEPDAGAQLNMTLRMDMDSEMRAVIQSKIAEGKKVAVLPITGSSVELSDAYIQEASANELPLFFKNIRMPKISGKPGDDIPISATLTPRGAKNMKAQLDTDGDLLPISYCYTAEGLGPTFNGRVHIRWASVYDYLKSSFSVGGFWKRANITRVTETLHRNGSISITADGGTAKEQEYLEKVADAMISKFFVNQLSTAPVDAQGRGGGLFTFNAGSVHRDELTDVSYAYTKRELKTEKFCPGIGNYDLKPYLNDIVRSAD